MYGKEVKDGKKTTNKWKEGKCYPRTGHERLKWEYSYSYTVALSSVIDKGGWSTLRSRCIAYAIPAHKEETKKTG